MLETLDFALYIISAGSIHQFRFVSQHYTYAAHYVYLPNNNMLSF